MSLPNPNSSLMAPPPSSSPPPEQQLPVIDPLVWTALADRNAWIPAVGSRVSYIPKLHFEHCTSPPDLAALSHLPYAIVRYVTSVSLHADPVTSEVFAKVTLDSSPPPPPLPSWLAQDPVFFATNLTPSDIKGAFTAPVGCAERVFPPVNWELNNVSHTISVRDVCGTLWEFNHTYRKKKKCNKICKGWRGFVENKSLTANDIIVFVQNIARELVVGFRRDGDAGGRVRPEATLEAVMRALRDQPFQVVYYPIFRPLDFLVVDVMNEVPGDATSVAPVCVEMSKESVDSAQEAAKKSTVISMDSEEANPASNLQIEVNLEGAETTHLVEETRPASNMQTKQLLVIDPLVWTALAGRNAWIPAVGSRVSYNPQLHFEHCTPSDLTTLPDYPHPILRYVTSVSLHADPNTSEVFAKVTLDSRPPPLPLPSPLAQDPVFFETNLTPSDIKHGFTAPVGCAERVFPLVDWELDSFSRTISVRDVRGTLWEFGHAYKKKKNCNTIFRGWRGFVKKESLTANDTIVFVRNIAGELVVGFRRDGNAGGRVRPEAVIEAVMRALRDQPFQVVYYPIFRPLDFLVDEVCVEMSKESADSARTPDLECRSYKYAATPSFTPTPAPSPVDADPSSLPYDPKTNPLAPRPQFLYYKPREEEGKQQEESFSSESYEDQIDDGSEEAVSELHQNEGLNLEDTFQETDESTEEAVSVLQRELEDEEESAESRLKANGKHRKSRLLTLLKAIPLLFIMVMACLYAPLSDSPTLSPSRSFILENINGAAGRLREWSTSSLAHLTVPSLPKKFGPYDLVNLTFSTMDQTVDSDSIFSTPKLDQAHLITETEQPVEEKMVQGVEVSIESDIEDVVEHGDVGEAARPVENENEVNCVEELELENSLAHDAADQITLEAPKEEEYSSVEEEVNSVEIVTVSENDVAPDTEKQIMMEEKFSSVGEDIKEEGTSVDNDMTMENYEDSVKDLEQERVPSGQDDTSNMEEVVVEVHKEASLSLAISPETIHDQHTQIQLGGFVDSLLGGSDWLPVRSVLGLSVAVIVLATTLAILYKKKKKQSSVVAQNVLPPETEVTVSASSDNFDGAEKNVIGDLGPSEANSYLQGQEKRDNGVDSLSNEDRRMRRDSTISSSISYGSYTTLEKISAKKGYKDEEVVTPVRRSSRIRSRVTSPSVEVEP